MKTVKILRNTTRYSTTPYYGIFVGTLMMIFTFMQILFAQAQDNWPKPLVALYDCNSSAAITNNTDQQDAINSASKLILQNILSDSNNQGIFLYSCGFTDTTVTDFSSTWGFSTLPDTGNNTNADYVIGSKITGSSGSYILTVSIEDGRTYQHVADGTATFDSANTTNVSTACRSAVQQILSLTTKIRSYQESLKSANPLLTINPQIDISLAKLNLPLKGSTDVSITAIDCDGMPITNCHVTLESSLGSLSTSTVQTDENGKTSAVFNAGELQGTAILTATIPNSISVTHDTISPSGSATVFVGDADTTNLWVLEYDLHKTSSGYLDTITQETYGTAWEQRNFSWTMYSHGKFIGPAKEDNTKFSFGDSALSVFGVYLYHSFRKYSGPSPTGEMCPDKYWEISGTSYTHAAKIDSDHQGKASFDYSPEGVESIDIEVPFTWVDSYGYDWRLLGRVNDQGQCETYSDHSGGHVKVKINSTIGIAAFGIPPVQGLSIIPSYAGSTISGYSITIFDADSYTQMDGMHTIYSSKCTATLKPLSNITGVKTVERPTEFMLTQNYPNPFNPRTTIGYELSSNNFVTLKVLDVLGREIAALVNQRQAAGVYNVTFDATKLSSGVYFYRLQAGSFTSVKKMLFLK